MASEGPPPTAASGMGGRQQTLLSASRATVSRRPLPRSPNPNPISTQMNAAKSVLDPAQVARAELDELEQITNEICGLYSTSYASDDPTSATKTLQSQDVLIDKEERAMLEKLTSAKTRLKTTARTVQDALAALQSCNQALVKENERLGSNEQETAALRRQLAAYQAAAAPVQIHDASVHAGHAHILNDDEELEKMKKRVSELEHSTHADKVLLAEYAEREKARREEVEILEQVAADNTAMAFSLHATQEKVEVLANERAALVFEVAEKAKRIEDANSAIKKSQEVQFEIMDAIKTMEKTVQKLKAAHLQSDKTPQTSPTKATEPVTPTSQGNLVSSTFGSLFRSNSARAFSPISPRSASSGGSRFPKLRRRHGERHLGTHVLEPEMARATFQIGGSSDECESPASGGGAATSGVNVWSMEKMQG